MNVATKHRTQKLKANIACAVTEKQIPKKHDQKRKMKKQIREIRQI